MVGRAASLAIALLTIGAAAGGACSGNHDDLAASGGAAEATAAATGGAMPAASSASVASAAASASSASSGGAGGGDAGPPGPTSLTVVNGVNDYDAIRLCFTAYPSGADVGPWPLTTSGLPFAGGAAIDPKSAVLPAGSDVLPYVIAGDLARTEGLTCAEILALASPDNGSGGAGGNGGDGSGGASSSATGGSSATDSSATSSSTASSGSGAASGATGSSAASSSAVGSGGAGSGGGESGAGGASLIVAPLAVLPASVFTSGKSVLLVPTGCLGGGHTGTEATQACGMDYAGSPNASLVAVAMSHPTDAAHIALQVVHASSAAGAIDVRVTPGFSAAAEVRVASSISLGTVAPVPPLSTLALTDFGVLSDVVVKTYAPNTSITLSTTSSASLFAHGDVSSTDFVDAHGFALVAVGGAPGATAGAWWHAFTYALVRTDP